MIYDTIIIGADSAGMTAGIYAGRKRMNALILSKIIGGQSLYAKSIENYPGFLTLSGAELVLKLKSQVEKFGISIKDGIEVVSVSKTGNIFEMKSEGESFQAKSVVIATGASLKFLNVPGEKKFLGRGVSICSVCDAPFFGGKDVAVVGGGNSALDGAYDLLSYANKIYLLQHRDKFIGDKSIYNKLETSGKVQFLTNVETKEIKGDKLVEALVFEDLSASGGKTKELKVGGVFVNIGQSPNSQFVKDLLKLNDKGEIIVDHKINVTSLPGVFAAGDVTDIPYKQVILAAASGAKALLSAFDYLKKH